MHYDFLFIKIFYCTLNSFYLLFFCIGYLFADSDTTTLGASDNVMNFNNSSVFAKKLGQKRQTGALPTRHVMHTTHPLMPGIRSAELWNPNWPRTLHDKQLTGFSPLTLDMAQAPSIWVTIPLGGDVNTIMSVTCKNGEIAFLVNDVGWHLVDVNGKTRWTAHVSGNPVFFGDLHGNGRDYVLFAGGPNLSVIDGETGETLWAHTDSVDTIQIRVDVADALLDLPGMEAVVFQQYGDEGGVLNFPPNGDPVFLWWNKVVDKGEWPERADHGCDVQFDLSVPSTPIVWNIRHHRCRGYDARNGARVSQALYDIGGEQRRNYGPWKLGKNAAGEPLVVVVGEQIQTHVHSIHLNRDGPSSLAWQHYYGEVYVVPGVVVDAIVIEDIDGDGVTELVYNVRDPEQDFRSFVRIRDANTGEIEAELADTWCVDAVILGLEEQWALLTYSAPNGAMPERGDLSVRTISKSKSLREILVLPSAHLWGPSTIMGQLLVRQWTNTGSVLVRYALKEGTLTQVATSSDPSLVANPIKEIVELTDEPAFIVSHNGSVKMIRWSGDVLWNRPVQGGVPARLSAADLNNDGRAEIIATATGNRTRIFSLDPGANVSEVADFEYVWGDARRSPLLYDLVGNGELYVIAPGSNKNGHLAVRAHRGDGSLLWETILDARTDDGGRISAWNGGQFLPGPRSGVAVSIETASRSIEGTYLLDGTTGVVKWFKDQHREGEIVRPFRPAGLMTAFDVDGDGLDEIGMDMLSYMAFLNGEDGSFALQNHSTNIRSDGALYAALLYNSFVPIYKSPEDERPHWFSPLGHGVFGLMYPEPTDGPWRVEAGYDTPSRAGLVDVDGDGVIEVGYTLQNESTFVCRDLWTGEIKWTLSLPSAPNGPVITADVDGDGKGEFITGRYCVGTDGDGLGQLRWEMPIPLGWGIIADVDGDGKGEIISSHSGIIYVMKPSSI